MKIKTAALVALIGVCLALLEQFYITFEYLEWIFDDGYGFKHFAANAINTLTWAALAYFFYMLYKKS